MQFIIDGIDMRKKKVGRSGGTGHVFVPKEWVGKQVAIVLVE